MDGGLPADECISETCEIITHLKLSSLQSFQFNSFLCRQVYDDAFFHTSNCDIVTLLRSAVATFIRNLQRIISS